MIPSGIEPADLPVCSVHLLNTTIFFMILLGAFTRLLETTICHIVSDCLPARLSARPFVGLEQISYHRMNVGEIL